MTHQSFTNKKKLPLFCIGDLFSFSLKKKQKNITNHFFKQIKKKSVKSKYDSSRSKQ